MTRLLAPRYLEIKVAGYGTFRIPPFSESAQVEFLAEQKLQDHMAARFRHSYKAEPMEYYITDKHVTAAQYGFEAVIKNNKEKEQ